MIFTTQTKNTAPITTIPLSGTLETYDQDNATWDQSMSMWDKPTMIITTQTKNTTAISNQTRNT